MKYEKTASNRIFDTTLIVLLSILAVITLYPYYNVVVSSFSNAVELYNGSKLVLLPKGFNYDSYRIVFRNPILLTSYLNTFIYVVLGTLVNMLMNIFGAYSLSKRYLPGMKVFMKLIVFTMFFSGGMIPTFLLVYELQMIDSIWAMILPNAVATMNIIIMRTYFIGMDPAIEESARMDGAHDFTILFKIILPLAKPVLAVITLYYAVGHWNSFFDALLYLRTRSKFPLQIILREILIYNNKTLTSGQGVYEDTQAVSESVKYALIVVSTVPILCLYPYLQKHFVKGIMIGSIK
jgi:putative aldouronate transport system permease protein